jgi:hypothetical protein
MEAAMPDFQLSLAPSQLSQVINPWSLTVGSLFTVNLGNAGDNEVEARVLARVGSYGRQIGQIGDAVGVLVGLIDEGALAKLTADQQKMIAKLKDQLKQIDDIKDERQRGRKMGTDGASEDGVKVVPPAKVTSTMAAAATVA